VFRHCHFLGWQDTILANRGRHYFSECVIKGAVDFIFGGATAYFERCAIQCDGSGYITAASTPDSQRHGFVFAHCTITGATPEVKTYLGRPWRDYAKTVFLHTQMSEVVRPAGWDNWKKPKAETTSYYAEFNSTGPGATPDERVPWAKKLTAAEADSYTLENVLGGTDGWNPLRQPEPAPPRKRKAKT
jgi:pectinesterase